MPVRVRPITLWRAEVDHQPGTLAQTLKPLAAAGADLQAVVGYRLPGDRARAAIEVFPVIGAKALSAAQAAGLSEADQCATCGRRQPPRPGTRHREGAGRCGDHMDFFLALVSGSRHATMIGFESREDAARAIPLLKGATAAPRVSAGRKTASKGARGATKRGGRRPARRRR